MRALITGASGFAGGYLTRACAEAGDEVVGLSRSGSVDDDGAAVAGVAADLLDGARVREVLRSVQPDVVYHLAALSSVGRSWDEPARTMSENVGGAANLLEAVALDCPTARLVWVSTCEVYGTAQRLPITEDEPLKPGSPYAVSKAAAEMLAAVYADAHGLDVVRARPFSHAGPRQRPMYVLSSLSRQAASARLSGARTVRIVTGNPDTRRDFTDVRDVARAYRLLGACPEPAVFNVSSGVSVSTAELVQLVGELIAPIELEHVVDPARVRAHEVMELRGSHERITVATGWRPQIPLRQTIADTIAWWEGQGASSS